jgi:hypothetical protein
MGDLAVGMPGEDLPGISDAGAVAEILTKLASGLLDTPGNRLLTQNSAFGGGSVAEVAEPGDAFGTSLACANYGLGGRGDVAIGVPGESVGSMGRAGAVAVLFGKNWAGLSPLNDQPWHQNVTGVHNAAEPSDRFGATLI